MSGYLKKYIGQFRIKCDYDLEKKDFIRDEKGNLDSSFDDFYIKCPKGIKIRHYGGKILFAYIPSIGRARNKLKQVYQDYIGNHENLSINEIYDELIKNGIITYVNELDTELEFRFKDKDIKYFTNLLDAQISGSNISPFSNSNLPKKSYNIPSEDLILYEEIIKDIPKNEILKVAHITKRFNDVIQVKKGKTYDIKAKQRFTMLKSKEFIHSIGLWQEYIQFLRENLKM